MSVRTTIGTVTQQVEGVARGSVSLAFSAATLPFATAARAAGFARGVVGGGLALVRGDRATPEAAPAPAPAPPAQRAPERDLPGPDIVLAEVPDPADLPEPIVIVAEDEPGEAFHTEPKPTSRVTGHGSDVEDLQEALEEAREAVEEQEPRP